MLVNEDDVMNIMGGMEHAGGIKLNDHKRKLKNRFEICRRLGQGTYGKVQLGINKETGQQVAIKTIKKSKIETEADLIRIRREIQIMSSVQHPNIIHIYEVFENKEKMVLVMEIAAGGELYDYLSERKSLEETEARRIFRQIACAVYYCHKNNICHRDLKLENILLDENGNAKIADFGLSNVYDGKNLLETYCGSPLYASPEIVRGSPYAGPEVDCWSLGVLLYTLIYGAMPFDGSNFKRLVKQITTGDYYEPKNPSAASGLVRTMLTVSSEKRANIGDICSHWWVNEGYSQPCLEEAEYLASLTPVRLDLLLSLAPSAREEVLDQESQVPASAAATPSLPPEEAMSIVELPPATADMKAATVVPEQEDHKGKRKLTETPSMGDPELQHSKKASRKSTTPVPTTPVPMEINDNAVYERQASPRTTPKVTRKKTRTPVIAEVPVESLVPEMTPEIQRKPPPKPKKQESDVEESVTAPVVKHVKKKQPRRERNVKTPDPTTFEEDQPQQHVRPMTPRQARAPSPEDRPLVVPLPPPRVQDIPLPPVRGESLERPALPPRPAPVEKEPALVVPLPPPRPGPVVKPVEEVEKKQAEEELRFQKQIEATISPDKVEVVTLNNPQLDEAKPFEVKLPALAQAKEGVRNSGHFNNSIQVTKPVVNLPKPPVAEPVSEVKPETTLTSLSRQEQAEDINEDISKKKSVLKNDQIIQENAMKLIESNSSTQQEGQVAAQRNKVGPVPMPVVQQPTENKARQNPSETMSPATQQGKSDNHPMNTSRNKDADVVPSTAPIAIPQQAEPIMLESSSPSKSEDGSRSLINSLPKPFKPNNIPNEADEMMVEMKPVEVVVAEPPKVVQEVNIEQPVVVQQPVKEVEMDKKETSSPADLSASSTPPQSDSPRTVLPQYHLLQRPEKRDNRDSKVIKAAAYWNNYIGEVMDKKKPPDNVKSLEKPKKIVSAGVGPKGYNDLKSAFEAKPASVANLKNNNEPEQVSSTASSASLSSNLPAGIQRRNSRKLPIEGCNPGLKVLDAKSAFEQKTQPQTPVIYRRNSTVPAGDKGKETDQGFLTSGPNYIKKKVPEFPPPPITKTPFGSSKSRAGALSPPNVPSEQPKQNGVGKANVAAEVVDKQPAPKTMTIVKPNTFTTTANNKETTKVEHSLVNGEVNNVINGNTTLSPSKPIEIEEQQQEAPKQTTKIVKVSISKDDKQQSSQTENKPKVIEQLKKADIKKPEPVITKEDKVKPLEVEQPKVIPVVTPKSPENGARKIEIKPIKIEKPVVAAEIGTASVKKVEMQSKEPNKAKPIERKIEIQTPSNAAVEVPSPPAVSKKIEAQSKSPEVVKKIEIQSKSPEVVKKIEIQSAESKKIDIPITKSPAPEVDKKSSPEIVKAIEIQTSVKEEEAMKKPVEDQSSDKKEAPHRIIPIQIEAKEASADNNSHHIPIHVEGKGPVLNRLNSTDDESRDGFSTNSLSRRRYGSRKKRSSFAYSDSSMTGDEDYGAASSASALAAANLSGLQKFTSIGKPGTEPMFRLRKTKPPFAALKSDSFSSGEEDDFDDDGFREIAAENLFSTLLTRVKSLTRKIHDDDHAEQLRSFSQNPRIINHRLNPGNTHARLERSALRNSLKRNNSNTLSRQGSMDTSSLANYEVVDDGTSSMRSYGSTSGIQAGSSIQRGTFDKQLEGKNNEQQQPQIMKRFDLASSQASAMTSTELDSCSIAEDTNVSVTSKQRLRPGYLPPPTSLNADKDSNSKSEIENALSQSSSMRNIQRKLSTTAIDTLSEEPRDSWSEIKSPYKMVQMKRLSVGLDLEDDRSTSSTTSGYFSAQQQPPPAEVRSRPLPGSRTSSQHQPVMRPSSHLTSSSSSRKGTAMDQYRKISSEMQMMEADIIGRLRREAAERAHDLEELSNGYTSPLDPDFFSDDTPSERIRKKSYLSRLDEDDPYSNRQVPSYRSSFSDPDGGVSRPRHVTRRSISRELHDFNPSWASNATDFSRSSRERSLGRDLEPILDVERRISNRRDNSLSRPTLASQGRSLTQSELGALSSVSTSSAGRRLSSGLRSPVNVPDDDYLSASRLSSKYSSMLDDRNRSDWRRVSVPERGKDFKSLSKKYNRYSSIIEDTSPDNRRQSYLATTSTSSKINPQFLMKTYRSNSSNRVMSPTFNSSLSSASRKPERSFRHSSVDHEPYLPSSGSSSSLLRLDNFVTLGRHRRDFSNHSTSPSPMILSPSSTKQFGNASCNSREGSVTPRFSHSCSNASLVSESAAD